MVEENDSYVIQEVSQEEFKELLELGCGIDQGSPVNYSIVNKNTKKVECYTSNLPNALHIANVFDQGIKKETNKPDATNVTPLHSH